MFSNHIIKKENFSIVYFNFLLINKILKKIIASFNYEGV